MEKDRLECQDYSEYKRILDFMRQDGVFQNTKVNERMYAGDQWFHVKSSNKLPRIIINFIKRTVNFLISAIHGSEIKINYTVQPFLLDAEKEEDKEKIDKYEEAAKLFTDYAETALEDLSQSDLSEQMIKDGLLSGLGLIHYYMDNSVITGNDVLIKGQLRGEIIDCTNYFPIDPTKVDVQGQKKFHLSFREDIEKVKSDAEKFGASKEVLNMIQPDKDTSDQSFDKAQYEVAGSKNVTVLLTYYRKDDGLVYWTKSIKAVKYIPEQATGKTMYPLIGWNGELRKRSIYGTAPVTEVIPNQIYVNTLYAMGMVSAQRTAYPKALYDKTKIAGVSNGVGGAIGVNGDIGDAFRYTTTGQIAFDMYKLVDDVVSRTKENQGANDVALGNIKPENTSAMLLGQQQAAVPIETPIRRYYKAYEDLGKILAEFWQVDFNIDRPIRIKDDNGKDKFVKFNGEDYKDIKFFTKIDVGAASQWSEIISMNTLNEWMAAQHISFVELLERFPKKIIPKMQQLIDDRKETEEFEMLAQYMETLPQEVQNAIMNMNEQEMREVLKELKELDEQEFDARIQQLLSENQAVQEPLAQPQQPLQNATDQEFLPI